MRPRFFVLGVLAIPVATTLVLASCTQVSEPFGGLTLRRGSTCVKACDDAYRSDQAECDRVLRAAIRACRQLPQSQREACYAQATANFTACSNEATSRRDACINGCHNQGGGSSD